jgi:uncharacterized protein (DUF433 family)
MSTSVCCLTVRYPIRQWNTFMQNHPPVVHSDLEILSGTTVFVGTRVPLRNLIDYLEQGYSLDEFLDAFPSVRREQAVAALDAAHDALVARARPA